MGRHRGTMRLHSMLSATDPPIRDTMSLRRCSIPVPDPIIIGLAALEHDCVGVTEHVMRALQGKDQ